MISAREHHAKAEELLEKAHTAGDQISRGLILAEAQVHATLALGDPGADTKSTGAAQSGMHNADVLNPAGPAETDPVAAPGRRARLSSPAPRPDLPDDLPAPHPFRPARCRNTPGPSARVQTGPPARIATRSGRSRRRGTGRPRRTETRRPREPNPGAFRPF